MSFRRCISYWTTRGSASVERFRLIALTLRNPDAATARVGIDWRMSIVLNDNNEWIDDGEERESRVVEVVEGAQ